MTLVETLVAAAISAVIIASAYAIFQTHHLMAIRQEETTLMNQELLAATTQITEELRMCGHSPTGARTFGFSHRPSIGSPDYGRVTNQTGIYCTLDSAGDQTIDESGSGSAWDHVAYRLNIRDNGSPRIPRDDILRKYDTGAVKWQPLCTNIGEIRFVYRNKMGEIIQNPEHEIHDIRMVELHVTAVPSVHRRHLAIANRTMSTTVWCRNLNGPRSMTP